MAAEEVNNLEEEKVGAEDLQPLVLSGQKGNVDFSQLMDDPRTKIQDFNMVGMGNVGMMNVTYGNQKYPWCGCLIEKLNDKHYILFTNSFVFKMSEKDPY